MGILQIATGVIYLVLSVAFMICGLSLISQLKKHYPDFYSSVKLPIWMATILLSITMLVRSALDIIRFVDKTGLDKAISDSWINNTYFAPLYNSMLFLFSDLIPILAQLLSLVFGIIRKRQ